MKGERQLTEKGAQEHLLDSVIVVIVVMLGDELENQGRRPTFGITQISLLGDNMGAPRAARVTRASCDHPGEMSLLGL